MKFIFKQLPGGVGREKCAYFTRPARFAPTLLCALGGRGRAQRVDYVPPTRRLRAASVFLRAATCRDARDGDRNSSLAERSGT